MTRTKVILLISFVLTFAAGAAVGVVATPAHHPPRRSWLTAELNLSPAQQDQMRKIWSGVTGSAFRQHGERRAALAQQRDQAIAALLTEEQRARYQAIKDEYTRGMDALAQERKKAFDEAVAQTKKILTPEQAAKYDELMKKQRERGMGSGPSGFRGPSDRHSRPDDDTRPPTERSSPRSGE